MKQLLPLSLLTIIACGETNKEDETDSSNTGDAVENCTDETDNDGDGLTDCDDSDCSTDAACESTEDDSDTDSEDEGSDTDTSSGLSGSLVVELDYLDASLDPSEFYDCTSTTIYTESTEAAQFTGCPSCTHQWRVDIEYSSDCPEWETPTATTIEIGLDLDSDLFYQHTDSFGWDTSFDENYCNGEFTTTATAQRFTLFCERLNGETSTRTSTLELNF